MNTTQPRYIPLDVSNSLLQFFPPKDLGKIANHLGKPFPDRILKGFQFQINRNIRSIEDVMPLLAIRHVTEKPNDLCMTTAIFLNKLSNIDQLQRAFDWSISYSEEIAFYFLQNFDHKIKVNYSEVLYLAAEKGYDKIVQLLLGDRRADPTARKNLAIQFAAHHNHYKIMKLLLDDGRADPTADNNYALRKAIRLKYPKVVKLLLDDGRADPNVKGNNKQFNNAWFSGSEEIVELFLRDKRVDPTYNHNYAMRMAAEHGLHKIIALFLKDKRINPAAKCNEPIFVAAVNGHDKVVKLLLRDPRVNPAAWSNRALIGAAENGLDKVVKLLLGDGRADPTAQNSLPLVLAADNGHDKVVELLLNDTRVIQAPFPINSYLKYVVRKNNYKTTDYILSQSNLPPHINLDELLSLAKKFKSLETTTVIISHQRAKSKKRGFSKMTRIGGRDEHPKAKRRKSN